MLAARVYDVAGTGALMHYLDRRGGDPPVLAIHGLGCAGSDFAPLWRAAEPPLAARRLLVPDLLGFGVSHRPEWFDYTLPRQAALLWSWLDELGVRVVDLVGHSMGGTIATLMALAASDRVARLVVVEPNLVASDATVSAQVAAQAARDFVAGFPTWFERQREEGAPAGWLATLRQADPLAFWRSAHSLVLTGQDPGLLDAFLRLQVPRAFIAGERTMRVSPPRSIPAIERAGVPVHVVPGAGHAVMEDNPEGFLAAVSSALVAEAGPPAG